MQSDSLTLDDFTAKSGDGKAPPRVYGEALVRAARADTRIIALSGDLTASTETDLIRAELPEQFRVMGMAEANMVGVAAGMARCGGIPLIHTFSVFASRRALDQVAMQVAYSNLNVKVVGFLPGLTTPLGVSHQAIDDVGLMRALPNMAILEPADADEVEPMLKAALARCGPVYLRMRRFESHADGAPDRPFNIGEPTVLKEGGDTVIFASGLMVAPALVAARRFEVEHGLSVRVVNVPTIKPLPREYILALTHGAKAVVTAENHSVIGGLGSAVAEILAEAGAGVPLRRVGIRDEFAEGGSADYLFRKYGLTAEAMVAASRAAIFAAGE